MSEVQEEALLHNAAAPVARNPLYLLCIYAFCLQFTPSEPYLVPFLTKIKNFSNHEITTRIFPISVYSTLICTLAAAPACNQFSYRFVIVIGTFSRLATYMILLFGKSLFSMQAMQMMYGLGSASDLIFSSYLFLLVTEDRFQSLTSFTQASAMLSFFIASELSQFLVSEGTPLQSLLYISIVMMGMASMTSIFLPRDESHSLLVDVIDQQQISKSKHSGFSTKLHTWFKEIYDLIKLTWQTRSLQMLSLWWALQVGGSSLIENYGTNLFDAVDETSVYNGHVIAATQGASCLAALFSVSLSNVAAKAGGIMYVVGSGVTCLLCMVMSCSKSIEIVYIAYVSCVAVNRLLLCILYVQCARKLSHGQYIFLFSLNSTAALLVQSILQGIIEFVGVMIFAEFYIIGGYFALVTGGFAVVCILYFFSFGTFRLVR